MEETAGSQYALQLALQTIKERCQQLQRRQAFLEEENIALRVKNSENGQETEPSEVDSLKQKIVQLTEQKTQLTNNVSMVASENRHLWARLSKLTQANQKLGSKLNNINDKLSQHPPLIRSKTFTQQDVKVPLPEKLVDENEKISLELEDISLKLISSIAKEKSELESQCSQMIEMQSDADIVNNFGFGYPGDEVEDFSSDFNRHISDLRHIKLALENQQRQMKECVNDLENSKLANQRKNRPASLEIKTESTQTIGEEKRNEEVEMEQELMSLAKWGTPENSSSFPGANSEHLDRICPMCDLNFDKSVKFSDFQSHVENHFMM